MKRFHFGRSDEEVALAAAAALRKWSDTVRRKKMPGTGPNSSGLSPTNSPSSSPASSLSIDGTDACY